MLTSSQLVHVMMLNTIGMSIISQALVSAAGLYMRSNNISDARAEEARESLMYIKGTGLDMTIEEFQIPLDPDNVRASFFTMINRRDHID